MFIPSPSTLLALKGLALCIAVAHGCTDILVTPGASRDGSAMIAYNADSPTLYGSVYHYPAATHPPGTNRQVYDWDSGVYLGEIDEALETYNVVGNANEHGLIIGESTFEGVDVLAGTQTDGVIDYGSLIYITLQRAKTCVEAVHIMANLMDTYGYYSAGESFSLADHVGDVWMMEVIGRGPTIDYGKKGAVWVAQKIPDGTVAAHANQARITTFARDDPEHCLYAADVMDVAVHYGLYPADADPLAMSFSDTFNPLTFTGTRQGEARVWSIFSQIASQDDFAHQYLNYALGKEPTNRMPLYIEPKEKLSNLDVMHLLTSHYEDTPMDSSVDVGAGLFASPYRPRPLVWSYNNTMYHNERSVATPKTGWTFVAQTRPWMPPPLAAVIWFACDDSSTAPRVPVYAASRKISPAYAGAGSQDGVVTPILEFDITKAFWVQNMVSNLVYVRWKDAYPSVRQRIDEVQTEFVQKLAIADQRALKLYHENEGNAQKAIQYMTLFSVNAGNSLHAAWWQFYGQLFAQFRDFYTITRQDHIKAPACDCDATEPGMTTAVQRRIVAETGHHYEVLDDSGNRPDANKQHQERHFVSSGPGTRVRGESWKEYRATQTGAPRK